MVGLWPHPPGTLRALLTILKGPVHVICRRCRRYAPLWAEREDLDRKYEPCPFRCTGCGERAQIVLDVPDGFTLTTPARRIRKQPTSQPTPTVDLDPAYRPRF